MDRVRNCQIAIYKFAQLTRDFGSGGLYRVQVPRRYLYGKNSSHQPRLTMNSDIAATEMDTRRKLRRKRTGTGPRKVDIYNKIPPLECLTLQHCN